MAFSEMELKRLQKQAHSYLNRIRPLRKYALNLISAIESRIKA